MTIKIPSMLAAAFLLAAFSGSVLAGEFDGTWKLKDTHGKSFEVTLNKDGTATGTLEMLTDTGSWKEEGGAAVINWKTGWTTRIAKKGNKYVKSAFKPGAELTGKPTNTSDASKLK